MYVCVCFVMQSRIAGDVIKNHVIVHCMFILILCNRLLRLMVFNVILGGHKANESPTAAQKGTNYQ